MKFEPRTKKIHYDAIKPSEFGDISEIVCRSTMDPWLKMVDDFCVDNVVEFIVSWGAGRYHEKEFVAAKELFDLQMGKSFYDENIYHARMAYFLDYFCFARPMLDPETAQGRTPFEDLLDHAPLKTYLSEQQIQMLKGMRDFRHSLFMVEKCQQDGLWVKDLLDKDMKFFLTKTWDGDIGGYGKYSVLQGFLFPWGEKSSLSRGVLEHPSLARKFIVKDVKNQKKSKSFNASEILSFFAKKHLSLSRWRQGSLVDLYKRP